MGCPFSLRAVITAKDLSAFFQTMPDDAHPAMRTPGRQLMDCAFEAIEDVGLAIHLDFERFVVFVSALSAGGHGSLL